MEQVPLATLAALGLVASQLTTLVRFLQASQFARALTTVIPWATAFLTLLLGAQAAETAAMVLPGFSDPLGDMGVVSLLFASLVVGSAGGAFHKVTVAVDNSQSSAEPPVSLGRAA